MKIHKSTNVPPPVPQPPTTHTVTFENLSIEEFGFLWRIFGASYRVPNLLLDPKCDDVWQRPKGETARRMSTFMRDVFDEIK